MKFSFYVGAVIYAFNKNPPPSAGCDTLSIFYAE